MCIRLSFDLSGEFMAFSWWFFFLNKMNGLSADVFCDGDWLNFCFERREIFVH